LYRYTEESPVVARGLELFRDHISGERLVRHHDLGTAVMARALKDVIAAAAAASGAAVGAGAAAGAQRPGLGTPSPDAAAAAVAAGIRMFRELPLAPRELAQMGRREGGSCDMAVKMWRGGAGGGGGGGVVSIVAFSRAVTIGDPSVSCRAADGGGGARAAADGGTRRGKRPAGAGDDDR
jgi:hypothetical protein